MYYGIVYKVTNIIDGKCYIGRTKQSLKIRWRNHCRKESYCLFLKHAIQKYGKEDFTIIEIASSWDAENLKELEALLIEQENTMVPNGYNLINTKMGVTEVSEETRIKLSEAGKGRIFSEETKEKIRQANIGNQNCLGKQNSLGHRHTEEWKEEARLREPPNKGVPMSNEQKILLSEIRNNLVLNGLEPWNKGIPVTEETKKKISDTVKAGLTDERRNKMSEAHKGKSATWNIGLVRSDETKRKISESKKGKNLGRVPWNAGLKTGPRSDETKQKISAAKCNR